MSKKLTIDDLQEARQYVKGSPRPHDPNRVMQKQCATCPWRTDGQGLQLEPELMVTLQSHPVNQYCHSPVWQGRPEDTICRGHRDHWINVFVAWGFLDEPTDAAWAKACGKRWTGDPA